MAMEQGIREEMKTLISGTVLCDEPLAPYTSMSVGGRGDILLFPKTIEELGVVVSYLQTHGIPWLLIGNGSNLIVRDGGIRGGVIFLKELRQIQTAEKEGGLFALRAEAGATLREIVGLSLRESWTGIEFCAGIPGTVGGALKMNSGAFGREMKDVVEWVTLMDHNGETRDAHRDALSFSYRCLELPADSIICAATFIMRAGDREAIQQKIGEIMAWRRQRHPLDCNSAGSIFKNPRSVPAGRLIEEARLKGLRIGDAQISEKHGNFIVNLGHATAGNILALIEEAQKRIMEEKGILLETEVKIVGTNG